MVKIDINTALKRTAGSSKQEVSYNTCPSGPARGHKHQGIAKHDVVCFSLVFPATGEPPPFAACDVRARVSAEGRGPRAAPRAPPPGHQPPLSTLTAYLQIIIRLPPHNYKYTLPHCLLNKYPALV